MFQICELRDYSHHRYFHARILPSLISTNRPSDHRLNGSFDFKPSVNIRYFFLISLSLLGELGYLGVAQSGFTVLNSVAS
jgi:hypothetical protein